MLTIKNKVYIERPDWELVGYDVETVRFNIDKGRKSWQGIQTLPHPTHPSAQRIYLYDSLSDTLKAKFETVFGDVELFAKSEVKLIKNLAVSEYFMRAGEFAQEYSRVVSWLEFLARVWVYNPRQRGFVKKPWRLYYRKSVYMNRDWFFEHICLPRIQAESLKGFKVKTLSTLKLKKLSPFMSLCKKHKVSLPLPGAAAMPEAFLRDLLALTNDGKMGTKKALKVNEMVGFVLAVLAAQDSQPYATKVAYDFKRFMKGELELLVPGTGEVIDPSASFFKKKGEAITLTERSVRRVLKSSEIKRLINLIQNSWMEYDGEHRPHVHRHRPDFSLSKLTMDDRDFPFAIRGWGTKRLVAYWVFDVTSQALVGYSFSKHKSVELIVDALRNTFTNPAILKAGVMPAEIENEQHLASTMRDGLLKQGEVFDFVRFCLGGNPKEKNAEYFIKRLRYEHEKNRKGFKFRPFAKLDTNRLNENRKTRQYTRKEVEENFLEDMQAYNNTLHPDQKTFPGMTRQEVLENTINPNLRPIDFVQLSKYLGYSTEVTIRKNQWVHCNGVKYHAPLEFLDYKRSSNKMLVRYIPGIKDRVWVYHGNDYLGEWYKIVTTNQAQVEQTEEDKKALGFQLKYRAKYDKMMSEQREQIKAVEVREVVPDTRKIGGSDDERDEEFDANTNPQIGRGNDSGDIYDMDDLWGT